jgi:hypothetical protein
MSAEAFRQVMKNVPELKYWATGQQDANSILHQTRESSKKEIENTIVDFVLPVKDLERVVGDPNTAHDILRELSGGDPDPFIELITTTSGQQVIMFKEIRFGKSSDFNKQIATYLANIAGDDTIKENVMEAVKFYEFDRGHVYGWANTLVKRTQGSIANTLRSRNLPPEQLEQELKSLETFIDSLLDVLEQYDEAASSLGSDLRANMFAQYRKTDSSWLIQWQGRAEQQKAGSGVATAIGKNTDKGVRGFLKAVGYQSGDALVEKALQGMVKGFLDQGLSKTDKNFLQLESSPKIIELIEDSLLSAATGRPKKYAKEYNGTLNNLADLTLQTASGVGKAKASIAKNKQELQKLKAQTQKAQQKVKEQKLLPKDSTVNLLNLQNLLNLHIQDVVSANMGEGNRKDILNYRTGRFAASVQVERLTMSREGMITAFYNYMKYPYATFSAGGRQSRPTSRDPKLLISKSIREIAAETVANRLRAVVV